MGVKLCRCSDNMISIIIPSYNRCTVIPRALDSIQRQNYLEWECIVVDDGSTDDTENVVAEYVKQDSRYRYLKNTRKKGAQGARNTGIIEAKGDWVVLFDSDNKMHHDFLGKVVEAINRENIDVCSTWSYVIDENTEERIGEFKWSGYGEVHNNLLAGKSYFDNSSTIIRRQLLVDIGLLDEDCPAFQEWDTHIRLSNIGRYYTIQEYLIDYYTGSKDSISASKTKDIKGYLFILQKYKKEWIKTSRMSFIKYCTILRMKMDIGGADNSYEISYRQLLPFHYRLVVYVMSYLYKLKNH